MQNLHGYGFNDHMEDVAPFFVRRWAPSVHEFKFIKFILILFPIQAGFTFNCPRFNLTYPLIFVKYKKIFECWNEDVIQFSCNPLFCNLASIYRWPFIIHKRVELKITISFYKNSLREWLEQTCQRWIGPALFI